jgi:16S rRNA (guanine966-N2)-methyltransferase
MRIIGGTLSGRNFDSVPGHRTHPMSEKVRGAIFNALGDIEGLTVFDAYGGTGALSFEALSRGASHSVALDSSPDAVKTIKQNALTLGIEDKISVSRIFVKAWSRRNQTATFDIVLLDPPYNAVELKELLALSRHAKKNGILVLSLPPKVNFRYAQSRQELLSHKQYGDAAVYFYRQL